MDFPKNLILVDNFSLDNIMNNEEYSDLDMNNEEYLKLDDTAKQIVDNTLNLTSPFIHDNVLLQGIVSNKEIVCQYKGRTLTKHEVVIYFSSINATPVEIISIYINKFDPYSLNLSTQRWREPYGPFCPNTNYKEIEEKLSLPSLNTKERSYKQLNRKEKKEYKQWQQSTIGLKKILPLISIGVREHPLMVFQPQLVGLVSQLEDLISERINFFNSMLKYFGHSSQAREIRYDYYIRVYDNIPKYKSYLKTFTPSQQLKELEKRTTE